MQAILACRAKDKFGAAIPSVYFHDKLCLATNNNVEALQPLNIHFNISF